MANTADRVVTEVGRRRVIAYFVAPSPVFAGIERVVHQLANSLVHQFGQKVDVHVVYCSDHGAAATADAAYRRHVLGVDRLRRSPAAIRSVVRTIQPDLLVVPQIEAAVMVWASLRMLPGVRRTAFVTHLHGNPRVEESGGTFETRLAFWFFRAVVRPRTAAMFAVSPSLARVAQASIGRGLRVYSTPNPVRSFARTPMNPSVDGVFRLVSVARLSHQKGQDLLLRGLAIARSDLPPVRVTLVGEGPAEAELRSLCTELGLDDIVEFVGPTDDPAPFLRSADAFVLASRWEGFGVALVEALSLGLPLLATDCDFGPSDIIVSPEIGELVSSDDPAALAEGLRLLAARRGRDTVAEAVEARVAVADRYSPAHSALVHWAALCEILDGHRRGGGLRRLRRRTRGAVS